MRICLLSREFPPDTGWGGVGTYTYQIACGLAARGHDVAVLSLAAAGGEDRTVRHEAGFTIHRVKWDGLLDELNLLLVLAPTLHFVAKTGLALWRRFIEIHNEKPFDVVEAPEHLACGFFNAISHTAPLVVKLHTPHAKFVADNYNGVLASFDNQMVALFERAGILQAEVVCSPSQDTANFVCRDTGMPSQRAIIARNPVDTEKFTPAGDAAYADASRPTVLFVGRLEQRKGIEYLIDAVPIIQREVPNARLLIIGADTNTAPGGTSMRAYLEEKLARAGSKDMVTFLAHVPLDQLPAVYRSANVCTIPSVYDNAPYTCLEAMSSGRPVVVSDAGGTQEHVVQGDTGFVVPARDAQSLGKALAALLQKRELAQSMGTNARKFVEKSLTREVIAVQMEGLYADAIARFSPEQKLYQKSAEELLRDTITLLCALDAGLFDMMQSQSLAFRVKHWMRFFATRPALCAASTALTFCKTLRLDQLKPTAASVARLENAVTARLGERYATTMQLAQIVPTERTQVSV